MIHIAMASDDNYAQHLAVAVRTVMDANESEIIFHIMDNGISEENKNKIAEMIKEGKKQYRFYDFTNLEEEYGFTSKSSVLPISAYARIFLPEKMDASINRVIYMDVDMVNVESLQEVYQLPLEECIIAGVQDFAGEKARVSNGYKIEDRYINSGFMLIDLVKWRENDTTNKIHKYILERQGYVVQEDQGAINAVLKGKIKIIHPRYNAMTPFFFVKSRYIRERFNIPNYYSDTEIAEAKRKPVIIHYLKFNGLANRPWEEDCIHPMRKRYTEALARTPWAGTPLLKDGKTFRQHLSCLYNLKMPYSIQRLLHR